VNGGVSGAGCADYAGCNYFFSVIRGLADRYLEAMLHEDHHFPVGSIAMYQVKDAMSTQVFSVKPETTVEDAIQTLLKHNISGAPVIDNRGMLCGIITQFQMLEVLYDPNFKNARIEECMTRNVLTVEEEALLGTATNLFVAHRIHRLPVVRGDKVVGIISRSDLLRYFVETGEEIDAFFSKLRLAQAKEAMAV
jgi:CBS domain-containing protein